ncbi:RT0821/Lpp0805 family surface protein [Pseudaminobacter sp. NGMCC 1.201702]|uniref:RT0821/Lpp0805 family surface protein n=1 Tax=Pseudaminobacter sp. NGMCC 1.201702 TaxID=3391825 RepID=UPI0039EF6F3B
MPRLFRSACLKSVPLLAVSLSLSACAFGGFSLEKAEVDRTLVTSNVPASQQRSVDAEQMSDEATIRNAVSSADLDNLSGPLPWANADTGSRGAISNLIEHKDTGKICRKFSASRESYDGVGLYHGEICSVGSGAWRMLAFQSAS